MDFYYKVKETSDQNPRKDGNILIRGELYTPSEMKSYGISESDVDLIRADKTETYWAFGARFV